MQWLRDQTEAERVSSACLCLKGSATGIFALQAPPRSIFLADQTWACDHSSSIRGFLQCSIIVDWYTMQSFQSNQSEVQKKEVLLAEKRGTKAGRQQVPVWWHCRKSISEVQRKAPCLEGLPSWKSISPPAPLVLHWVIGVRFSAIRQGALEIHEEHFMLNFADFSNFLCPSGNDFFPYFYPSSGNVPSHMMLAH